MLVSILIPCYNVEEFLPQCLASVLSQTYKKLQVVLVDDGSKDGTLTIAQEYAKKDSRVEVYHQENQGVAVARNELLKQIKGDYFLFVDSDDWIESDMVEFLVARQKETGADIVTCTAVVNDAVVDKTFTEESWNQPKAIEEFLRHQKINGSLWNKLVKTSLLHNVKFHCGISYGEDALFCWGILQYLQNMLFTDKQLYHYRMNEGSISHSAYGPKRMSAHLTWKILSEEASSMWPKFRDVAVANYVISDMWQIFDACRSSYKMDENIKAYQKNLRDHLCLVLKSDLINIKKKLFAIVAAYSYCACRFFIS